MLTNSRETDLNAPSDPRDVAQVIRNAAQLMREQTSELQSAWSDPQAGKVWEDLARVLDRAADSCVRACERRGV